MKTTKPVANTVRYSYEYIEGRFTLVIYKDVISEFTTLSYYKEISMEETYYNNFLENIENDNTYLDKYYNQLEKLSKGILL